MTQQIIAYGRGRQERDFAHVPHVPGKVFIDTSVTGEAEFEAMLACVEVGVTVAVLSMADLGRGMGQVRAVKAIEAAGGTVKETPSNARPAPPKVATGLSAEQEAVVCSIWGNKALSEATRLARINALPGVNMDKNRVHYICVTKPARKAKRQEGSK